MFRFIVLAIALSALSVTAADSDSAIVSKTIKKKLNAKSVSVILDGDLFVAKTALGDSAIVLVGGIGKSTDMELSMDEANLNASHAAAALFQGKFGTGETISPVSMTTAFAQKGEWLLEGENSYLCIKVLDADKIIYR